MMTFQDTTCQLLEFVLPPVNDNEDLILKEENPEIYVHLENVLVHMIDTQDMQFLNPKMITPMQPLHATLYLC